MEWVVPAWVWKTQQNILELPAGLYKNYQMAAWIQFQGWTCRWWIPRRWWWPARSHGRRPPSGGCWWSGSQSTHQGGPGKNHRVKSAKAMKHHAKNNDLYWINMTQEIYYTNCNGGAHCNSNVRITIMTLTPHTKAEESLHLNFRGLFILWIR